MIIDQDEHDDNFFKIYNSITVKSLDFLRTRKIDTEEVKEKIMEIMDTCTKVIFLVQRLEQNDDVIDQWIEEEKENDK